MLAKKKQVFENNDDADDDFDDTVDDVGEYIELHWEWDIPRRDEKSSLQILFTFTLKSEIVESTTMAYDRYVAICFPLHYSTVMNHHMCMALLSIVMAIAVTNSWVHTGLILKLTFCGPNTIDHLFCEIPTLLSLSCSPVKVNEVMVYIADITLAVGNFTLTCISCAFIIAAILHIRTAAGKRKAFSTCSSHLIVVSLYYCPVIYTYVRPASSYTFERDKVVAALYTLVTPTLNPVVYSFRNKEMQTGIKKVFSFLKH
ncbi:olfactory receptor 13G1-like [Equus asinus]|uniref:olfactory receptor 13G1-like n=1 Tax=Equus asinus TaxID=9793 RepID=UPI001D05B69A|nr:olfactory receptor 13G1-like [Equus asinus]